MKSNLKFRNVRMRERTNLRLKSLIYEKFDMAWYSSGDIGNFQENSFFKLRFEEVEVVDP